LRGGYLKVAVLISSCVRAAGELRQKGIQMKRRRSLLTIRWPKSLRGVAVLLIALGLLTPVNHAPNVLADNVCLNGAVVQINQTRYLGKDANGDDKVTVEWLVQSSTECIPFGGGKPVDDRVNVLPFGYELTVKIKRRLGHEDSGKVIKRDTISGRNVTLVIIPRGALETDPVSYTVTLKTTAGSVQTFNRVITGLGVPSLAGATQSTNQHSTVTSVADNCFPSLAVTAINFIPGSGATPDNVAITWASGIVNALCNEQPRFKVKVIVKRPAGNLDTVQTVFAPNSTTAQLQLPGGPTGATNFNVTITALAGNVIEKTDTQSGNF
jgi:hypothetical protein